MRTSSGQARRRRATRAGKRGGRQGGERGRRRSGRPSGYANNADVAAVLREIGNLLEAGGENPFRIRAYRNAARVIDELRLPLSTLMATGPPLLDALPGIGADLAGKIAEIARTGSLGLLRELRRATPGGAVQLMRVDGIGPRRARILSEQLGIRSIAGLARAARQHRIRSLPGFGTKTESRILAEATRPEIAAPRMLRAEAFDIADALVAHLRAVPGVHHVDVAGSFRRARETVGDLDILVTAADRGAVARAFVEFPSVAHVLARGRTRAAVRLAGGLQVDLRVVDDDAYGAGLYYFTGSRAHTIAVRRLAQERGLKLNEYGVWRGRHRVAGRTESEVAATVGLPWIPPELREARGEIEAARKGALPKLVELAAIRGDMQAHTTDSDGRDSLEAMADGAEALGYEYLAITDHTPRVRVTGGLTADGFRRQMKRIDRLNRKLRTLTLLKGAEVDILTDGSLDLDNATLDALDIVLVSLHTALGLDPAAQTARIVRALRNRHVDVLAHPTARLINGRTGAAFDLDEVCRVAAGEGKMLEINAQPARLDLDDLAARIAIGHGVTLTIGSDAHATAELAFMRWGVDQARRGWVTARDVLNTRSLAGVLDALHAARR